MKRTARESRVELMRGTLDLMILRTLLPGPSHGHAIAKHIQRTTDDLLQVDQLDPELALMIDSLREGGISQPHVFMNQQNGERSCRIVFLKDRVPPHKANLTDDYNQIQQVALQQKQQKQLEQWLVSKLPSFFIRIDPEFQGCDGLKDWVPGTARQ